MISERINVDSIYEGNVATLLQVLESYPGDVMLVGHNPGFEALLAFLCTGQSGNFRGMSPGSIAWMTLPDGDLPQATVSTFAAQRRFRAAWAGADRTIIRSTAGELRLLMPDHPDVQGLEFVLSALTPTVKDDALKNLAANLLKTAKGELIVLKMMTLAPERAEVLRALLPKTSSGTFK